MYRMGVGGGVCGAGCVGRGVWGGGVDPNGVLAEKHTAPLHEAVRFTR